MSKKSRLFFADFRPAAQKSLQPPAGLNGTDARLREYLCYVLLDFVTADPELEELPLAAALDWCRRLELDPPFEKLAAKELRLRARDLKRIKEQAAELLAKEEALHA